MHYGSHSLGEYHSTWVVSWRLKGEETLLMPELNLLCKKMRDRESERGFACICLAGKKSEGEREQFHGLLKNSL